jgi:large subunit ribosomal protein L13
MADQKKTKETKKEEAKGAELKAKKATSETKAAKTAKPTGDKPAKKAGEKAPAGKKRNPLLPRTPMPKVGELNQDWKLVDASNIPLGRLSSQIALMLMGKTKPTYSPSIDTGDNVIVVNAEKVVLTGKKWDSKVYQYHTNFPGGLKTSTAREVLTKHPERLIKLAVYRMLPKSKGHMARTWFQKLRVYPGLEHPHKAQKPVSVKLTNLGTYN